MVGVQNKGKAAQPGLGKGIPVTWDELRKHNTRESSWMAIRGQVYDITTFISRHPGGNVIGFYKGTDGTDSFQAFHPESSQARCDMLMKPLLVGPLVDGDHPPPAARTSLVQDFRKLEASFHEQGLFRSSKPWYLMYLLHVLALEAAAMYTLSAYHSWGAWLVAVFLLATAQIQAGWLQHDFGHLSVFESSSLNQLCHWLTIGFLKGASSDWWKWRHNRHHAKTNVHKRDPDLDAAPVFIFGVMGKIKKLSTKYTPLQPLYWFVFGPPTVTTLLFVVLVVLHLKKTKEWQDILAVASYFVRYGLMCSWLGLGLWSSLGLYFSVRLVESHWFTWVTSMNHLPMPIDLDTKGNDSTWLELAVRGTQNVYGGALNDWFTGHLNYQVEHHLFPRMPRHNYPAAQPQLEALLDRHGLTLQKKGLLPAMWDVVGALSEASHHAQHAKAA